MTTNAKRSRDDGYRGNAETEEEEKEEEGERRTVEKARRAGKDEFEGWLDRERATGKGVNEIAEEAEGVAESN